MWQAWMAQMCQHLGLTCKGVNSVPKVLAGQSFLAHLFNRDHAIVQLQV